MSIYAIGIPGQKVSRFCRNITVVGLQSDEVALLLGDVDVDQEGVPLVEQTISSDGTQLVPYQPTIIELRDSKLASAVAHRNYWQESGCLTPLGRVDTDQARSIGIINSNMAAAGSAISLNIAFPAKKFTMADGTQVQHTARQLVNLGIAVNTFLDACQARYVAIKASIKAATSEDALAAIDVTTGYPSNN